jgi:CBS domain-containing protein
MTTDELVDEERQWTDAVRDKAPAQLPLYQQLICEPIEKTDPRRAVCVSPETSVREAINLMKQHGHGCVLVEKDDRLVGIFTERDVLFRVVGGGRDPATLPVADVMTPDPEALTMKDELAYVLNLMAVGGFRHVPIVDEERRPVAVFSVRHIVERLVDFFPNEVLNLPPRPGKNVAHSREGA